MLVTAEDVKIVNLLEPATDAAGRTGAWVSLKNFHRASIICTVAQGNAAVVPFTVQQATAVAGTGQKDITATGARIYTNLDTDTNDKLVRQANGKTFSTDAALKTKQVIFDIEPAQCLDLANGFDCISVKTGASNAANLTSAIAILHPRYPGSIDGPSAVVD